MVEPRLLAFATQGAGGNDEFRLRALLERFTVDFFPFDHGAKWRSFQHLRKLIPGYDLVVMEGTGIAGGLALLAGGAPYIFSSGDAIAPFIASKQPLLAPCFQFYERLLCRKSRGYIGWTPYLAGRALTFGAPRALTAAGWAPFRAAGLPIRSRLNIPAGALVIGIVGSLEWNARAGYCYGYELARAAKLVKREDVMVLIVGNGSGLERLRGDRVILPGAVSREEIPDYLAAMDLASLPQSRDALGSFRFSTKLSEYVAAGLPVVTGQLPLAYDLDCGWIWRLPGAAPWKPEYIEALAKLLDNLSPEELAARRAAVPHNLPEFDRQRQVDRVTRLIEDVLAELR